MSGMAQATNEKTHAEQTDFLHHLFVPVYMPAIVFATGEGSLIPIVPLTAKALGANLATAGIISGLLMIGVVLGDVPSGFIVNTWGETVAMRIAAILAIISAIFCWRAPNLVVLAAGVLVIGIASATFNLARHAFLTAWTPPWYRARAMSLLGGTTRIGYFVGPFIASPVIALTGSRSVYWIHVVACLSVLVVLQVTPDPEKLLSANRARAERGRGVAHAKNTDSAGAGHIAISHVTSQGIIEHGHTVNPGMGKYGTSPMMVTLMRFPVIRYFSILCRIGTAAGILQMMRASRQVILPLWGVQLNISAPHIALIMGVAGAVDLSLFYTSGQIMDRFGRRWAAVPVLLGISLGHLLMPFATVEWTYICIAILISVANGLGSGIIMTLGADLASRYAPENMPGFLSGWRMSTDSGSAVGPLAISGMTALSGLWSAAVLMGSIGLVGAYMMQRFIPRFIGK
ncbi:MAG: MFS transporter [Bifidobacterium aquikefiri]|uniref:MFS permease n=1 Tax=Bifidobacterium aquikefiri TaxID=1653207 RepID=A0A261G8Y2_9BIFI|nr:MFS transporter [Bifidobacterium aquikefiri]OZG67889.1 MFS permease [Bifidobacterium aquikefiri]